MGYFYIKNILDRVTACILFILLIIVPVLPIVVLLIFWEERQQILFVQERVGLNKKSFRVIKFRTMHKGADDIIKHQIEQGHVESLNFKKDADSQVTKLGKFLRSTSLDELPQLINIIKGEMSVIGPRPLQQFEVDDFEKESEHNKSIMAKRLEVKPGLLCYWQVTQNKEELPFKDRMKLDQQYAEDISLMTDIKILFLGVKTILTRNNM